MNEEVSNRRLLVIAAVIAAVCVVLVAIVAASGKADRTQTGQETTTSTTTTTTTESMQETTTVSTVTTTRLPANNNSTTAREDRYDFREATTTARLYLKNCYQVEMEFDGWQLYLDNAVYDEAARTLSFDFRQVCTRKNAQPIYYEISKHMNYAPQLELTYTEQELAAPSLPVIYYSLDHLQAREFRVTVQGVDPDFTVIYIDLETMSVPDDDTAVYGGTIITETLYLQQQQIPRV